MTASNAEPSPEIFQWEGFAVLRGAFRLCGGLDIIKLTKTPLIYSVSRFNLGSLELCLGGWAHQSPPVATGLLKRTASPGASYAPKRTSTLGSLNEPTMSTRLHTSPQVNTTNQFIHIIKFHERFLHFTSQLVFSHKMTETWALFVTSVDSSTSTAGVTNLFAIAGHFVSYLWVSGPHNFLVILWNLLKTKKIVHQQKQTNAGRTKFFCGPHVRHPCSTATNGAALISFISYLITSPVASIKSFWIMLEKPENSKCIYSKCQANLSSFAARVRKSST